jgi:D-arginine dehydrogenase
VVDADVIVVGAGIAGASLACFLGPHAHVVMLESETQPGFHSTGRSAAIFMETYGSPQVRSLTRASRAFLEQPPAGFCAHPLLTPRGALSIGGPGDRERMALRHAALDACTDDLQWLKGPALRDVVPVLQPHAAAFGILERGACDIDVNELHQGFLRGHRRHRGELWCDTRVAAIEYSQGAWQVDCGNRVVRAPLLANAAGAWVDEVAAMAGVQPIGIQPKRRTAFLFKPPEAIASARWPFVSDLGETFYFKPDAGLLLGSAANADPVRAQDVQPEDLDVAYGVDAIEQATSLRITRPVRVWAGLRSFVADGDLVGGFAVDHPAFFWVAAQGGYGIQTAPAMGQACAQLILQRPLPAAIEDQGIDPLQLSPSRLTVGSR